MSKARWLVFGTLCEAAGVLIPVFNEKAGIALSLFFLLHFLGCLCLALFLSRLLPGDSLTRKKKELLVFSFAFFIPLFGFIGMLLILLHFRLSRTHGLRPEFFSIPQLPFAPEDGVKPTRMGEGGAWSRLKTKSVPRAEKLEALMAAGSLPGQNSSRLLRFATGDSDDEIRLAAFNFIDKREKTINASINQLLAEFKVAANDHDRGELCAKLAFVYWEFVYNDLARAELMNFYLDQALSYALKAEELVGESHSVSILKGRIHLRRGNRDSAELAMDRALELGAAPDKVVPFQAEILYLKRDFGALRDLLAQHAQLRHKPGIGSVVSFWTGA